jgi:predicted O-methyltransferase YrrM
MTTRDLPPPDALRLMINGSWVSQALCVAATLGLADQLRNGAKTADELAQPCSAHGPSLHRLMRALASVGVFSEDTSGRFGLTPLAEPLGGETSGSQRAWAVWAGQRTTWAMWGELLHCIKTGRPAFPELYGMPAWRYYQDHPDQNAIFNAAMAGTSRSQADAIVRSYDFSGIDTIVDVGGGDGTLLAAVLAAQPRLRGVLFDQTHVVSTAGEHLAAAGVADRCRIVTGDFFTVMPEQADAYMLKFIIHDWDDPEAQTILRNCRRAMRPSGRILLIERVIPPGNEPHPAKFGDLLMLVMYGGRERTVEEFTRLVAGAGLVLTAIAPVASAAGLSIVEARAALSSLEGER